MVGLSHRSFDVKGTNILPSFFHEGDQEVDGHGHVLSDLFFSEVEIADGCTHAVDFLGVELDGLLELIDFRFDFLSFSKIDGESAHLDQYVSEKLGDLLSD